MGLANSNIVKGVVDILTNLLNLVNKITGAFGNGVGGILKWVAALGALGGARQIFSPNGIGTKIIGGVVGSSPVANHIKAGLGLGKIDENGVFTRTPAA